MKASARIQTCIELLEIIQNSKIPMDKTIRDYMHHRRYIGSKDRSNIVERIYKLIRHHSRLGWYLEKLSIPDTARARVIVLLVIEQEHLEALFCGEKFAPQILNDEEKYWTKKITSLKISEMPLSTQVECPKWAIEKLEKLYDKEFETHLKAMLEPATLDLRVNTLKGTVEDAQKWLAAQDVETIKTLYSPVGLRVKGKAFMTATKAYSKGMVEIQDEGSQLIAQVSDVKPGFRVLDYCAGAGGKTLAIAAMMENKGNVTAMDIDPKRLEKGRKRYRKAGVHNVEIRCLEDEKNKKWLRRQKNSMDVVIADVPCSSSGTWRRNPDLRWRWYGPSLDEIMAMQSDILERVADKVKIGGRLIYATCSLLEEENEHQVENFLKSHADYKILPLPSIWNAQTPVPSKGSYPYLRLTPKDHGTDGFFAAILERN